MASYLFQTRVAKTPVYATFFNVGSGVKATNIPSGSGSITGRVTENGLPVSRRVMLYERKTGALAAQTRSGEDGYYTFKKTNERTLYFAVSIDDENDGVQYNLQGKDLISGNHDNLNP